MSKSEPSLSRDEFNALAQMGAAEVRAIFTNHEMLLPVSRGDASASSAHRRFSYEEALCFEVARQLSDNSGVAIAEAFRLIAYTAALQGFFHDDGRWKRTDFWLAVAASRNTSGDGPRGSIPVTAFGPKEYWSEMHYTGSLGEIAGEISESIGRDQAMYPDSDPARIFMANVSTADRRLRKRAAEISIAIAAK